MYIVVYLVTTNKSEITTLIDPILDYQTDRYLITAIKAFDKLSIVPLQFQFIINCP